MRTIIFDPFDGILKFLLGDKRYLNKKEAQKIFYSKESHFDKALENTSTIVKQKAPSILTTEAADNAICIAEQIALTVDVK